MSWTYTSDIENEPKDWIRFIIGDTNSDDPLLSDEEINSVYALTDNNKQEAAKMCMQHILMKLAQQVDFAIGTTKVFATDKYNAYKQQYKDTLQTIMISNTVVSGINTSDPIFTIGMHD